MHLSTYDEFGGAARAANRILMAQLEGGIDASMLTLVKHSEHPRIAIARVDARIKLKLVNDYMHYLRDYNNVKHKYFFSDGSVSAGLAEQINNSDADIIHLHWISYLLSIEDIGNITKPVVWTLHDMWPFCGGEHYIEEDNSLYEDHTRVIEQADTVNSEIWERKCRSWKKQRFNIVSPSHWLAGRAKKSALFNSQSISVIPYPVDTNKWKPVEKDEARKKMRLPAGKKLLLFVISNGINDFVKGWDLLIDALDRVKENAIDAELIIAGSDEIHATHCPIPVRWLGRINDDTILADLYGAADVTVVPSRLEAFSQVTAEAQACGCPVAAFDIGGPNEIIIHKKTGWLAKCFEPGDLAAGISWCLGEPVHSNLSIAARENVLEKFSYPTIGERYSRLYGSI